MNSPSLGAWLIHLVLIVAGKVCTDAIPGMTREISWTLVNLIYMAVCIPIFLAVLNTCHRSSHQSFRI